MFKRLRLWAIAQLKGNWNITIETSPRGAVTGCMFVDSTIGTSMPTTVINESSGTTIQWGDPVLLDPNSPLGKIWNNESDEQGFRYLGQS